MRLDALELEVAARDSPSLGVHAAFSSSPPTRCFLSPAGLYEPCRGGQESSTRLLRLVPVPVSPCPATRDSTDGYAPIGTTPKWICPAGHRSRCGSSSGGLFVLRPKAT